MIIPDLIFTRPTLVSLMKRIKALLWITILSTVLLPVAGYGQSGYTWSTMTSGVTAELRGVRAFNDQFVVAVGTDATMLRYNGTGWEAFPGGATAGWPAGSTLTSVTIVGLDDIWVGSTQGNGLVSHWDGASWSTPAGVGWNQTINGLWHLSSDNVIAVGGTGRIAQWNGSSWSRRTNISSPAPVFTAVHGSGHSNVWAVSNSNRVYRSTDGGTTWLEQDGLPALTGTADPARLNGVYSLNSSATWFVGDRSWEVALWDGEDYTLWQLKTGAGGFKDVYAHDENNVWVVGTGGTVFHYDGADWTEVQHGLTTSTLWSVDRDLEGQLFVVGSGGVILTAAIPEPVTTVLLMCCLSVVGVWIRRRSR